MKTQTIAPFSRSDPADAASPRRPRRQAAPRQPAGSAVAASATSGTSATAAPPPTTAWCRATSCASRSTRTRSSRSRCRSGRTARSRCRSSATSPPPGARRSSCATRIIDVAEGIHHQPGRHGHRRRDGAAEVVYVMGEVNEPGALPLKGQMTVLQALAMAGGFKDFANTKNIRSSARRAAGCRRSSSTTRTRSKGKGQARSTCSPATPSSFRNA